MIARCAQGPGSRIPPSLKLRQTCVEPVGALATTGRGEEPVDLIALDRNVLQRGNQYSFGGLIGGILMDLSRNSLV